MSILTDSHLEQFHHNGYLLVENVVPSDNLKAALQAIENFAGLSIDNSSTWTHGHPDNQGLVPLHHAQAFWDNRQYPKVHQLFSELWGTQALWVTMDRASFHPPHSVSHCHLHWDADPANDSDIIQGMLYLTDAPEERAAFRCAPQVYRSLENWLRQQGPTVDYQSADFSHVSTVAVPGKAGDMVIWNAKLPHCPGANFDDQPRAAQYITMYKEGNEDDRQNVISWWHQKRPPIWWRGLPTQQDPEPGDPALLTPLGRKLVGLDPW